jgi:hypothetical protein
MLKLDVRCDVSHLIILWNDEMKHFPMQYNNDIKIVSHHRECDYQEKYHHHRLMDLNRPNPFFAVGLMGIVITVNVITKSYHYHYHDHHYHYHYQIIIIIIITNGFQSFTLLIALATFPYAPGHREIPLSSGHFSGLKCSTGCWLHLSPSPHLSTKRRVYHKSNTKPNDRSNWLRKITYQSLCLCPESPFAVMFECLNPCLSYN